MSLKISKMNSGDVLNAYDIDVGQLFDAFTGLEQQTKSLGSLMITPILDGVAIFKITQTDGTVIFSVDSVNRAVGIGCNVDDYLA